MKGVRMENDKTEFTSIDEYITLFPGEVQKKLIELRAAIKAAAPEAGEKISWRMPTFTLKGNLVHFAAYKHHIGFYPGASGIQVFAEKLSGYESSKGAVRFPIDKPLPLKLIGDIVKNRITENLQEAELKTIKKKKSAAR